MTAAGALRRGRRMAEKLMVEAVRVVRLGAQVVDPVTGDLVQPETEVYAGKAKVQTYEAQESNPDAGGHTYTVQRYAVHLPVGGYAPVVGHVITVTTAVMDPNLTGRKFRVVALLHKSMATAYRLGVEEVPA
ncbi:DUF6093 family protein [Isoptericola sp. QY 916]|uniref:DUF6093 family protein n=1 Tax=Isoptericola sp. QY 916 TaxID=2782570 RepID=UPI003D3013CB|nr:hypothetical protein [Isoptericola sp. QY 916]